MKERHLGKQTGLALGLGFGLVAALVWMFVSANVPALSAGSLARPWLAPAPIGTDPGANALNVPLTADVSVTFDEPINLASVTNRTFGVYGSQSPIFGGDYSLSNSSRTVTLDPARAFFPGERVNAVATTGIQNTSGEPAVRSYVWQFWAATEGGSGHFLDSGQRLTSMTAWPAALGDIDGDGDLDAYVPVGEYLGPNHWFLNDGTGMFSDSGQPLGNSWTLGVALGDLDGDGDLDTFEANWGGQPNQVWLNDGAGNFSDSGQRLGNSVSWGVALGDLDGDGDLDALVINEGPNEVWLNDGAGIFTDSGQSVDNGGYALLGDLDGDGDLDALVGPNEVWLNDGAGIFTDSGQSVDNGGGLVLGDLDGDGYLDVFVSHSGEPHRVWLNDGAGGFRDSGQELDGDGNTHQGLGDVDGDGDLDVVVMADHVWLNDGSGTFSGGAPTWYGWVTLGDLDGDGDLDNFVARWGSTQVVLLNYEALYVDQDASGANNGSSWANAFTDLQSALSIALPGDEIWVAAGTYKPSSGTDRTATFQLKNGVVLYGGFAGNETSRGQRDRAAHPTTLSGDIGAIGNNSDNSYNVVTGGGTDASAVLDGFTISGGNANREGRPMGTGGGMYNNSGNPTVRNVIFAGNSAVQGGGMYNWVSSPRLVDVTFSENSAESDVGFGGGMDNANGSNPTLVNVTFSENSAGAQGGGMWNWVNCSPSLVNVTFSDNSAGERGGGIYNQDNSNPTLVNVTFSGNTAKEGGGLWNYISSPMLENVTFSTNSADYGGGLYNRDRSRPTLTDVTFIGNSADYGGGMHNAASDPTLVDVEFIDNNATMGGAIHNQGSAPALTNVSFRGNDALVGGGMSNMDSSPILVNVIFSGNSTDYGGGMYNQDSSPRLVNSVFSGNTAKEGGGAIYNAQSDPVLTNVTFSGNSATRGGAMSNDRSDPALDNCILWNNTTRHGGQIYNEGSSTPIIRYSLAEGGYPGTGNIDRNPRFVDADGPDDHIGTLDDNLRLGGGSAAIDAGDNDAVPADDLDLDGDGDTAEKLPFDLDGQPRIVHEVDMGAYETPPFLYVKPGGSGNCSSWAAACSLQSALEKAEAGDEIWVAEGMYKPSKLTDPGDPRTATFRLKAGVALYGGFSGTEDKRNQRSWRAHKTILSGNIGSGYNSYHVLIGADDAVLDGFTITGGNAKGTKPNDDRGGGMYNDNCSPVLVSVAFSGNSATHGGGIYNGEGSHPELINVTFSGNSASTHGGGVYNGEGSHPTLINVTFSGNAATEGGGVFNNGSSPALSNCILWGNTGSQVANVGNSNPTIGYSLVQGGCPSRVSCDHVVDANPQFVDAANGDLRLQDTSPAIDAGNNSALPADWLDLDGDGDTTEKLPFDLNGYRRLVDMPDQPDTGVGPAPIVDMGASEAQSLTNLYLPLLLKNMP